MGVLICSFLLMVFRAILIPTIVMAALVCREARKARCSRSQEYQEPPGKHESSLESTDTIEVSR